MPKPMPKDLQIINHLMEVLTLFDGLALPMVKPTDLFEQTNTERIGNQVVALQTAYIKALDRGKKRA